jgi:hypothetical protein
MPKGRHGMGNISDSILEIGMVPTPSGGRLKENMMKSRTAVKALVTVLLLLMAGCATLESAKHEYIMRGQVLEATGDTVYLCIGSKDGAQVGQEYTVYRYVKVSNPSLTPRPYYIFRREQKGEIKITEIVDEHMATAKVVRGEVKEHDVVELNP